MEKEQGIHFGPLLFSKRSDPVGIDPVCYVLAEIIDAEDVAGCQEASLLTPEKTGIGPHSLTGKNHTEE